MRVFIDTSCFIALLSADEQKHQTTVAQYNRYKKEKAVLFTSDYVLDELFTRLIYDFNKESARKAITFVLDSINSQNLRLLEIDRTMFQKAVKIVLKFVEHKISFTDATTYVLYHDLKLDEVFTLDGDFKKMRVQTCF